MYLTIKLNGMYIKSLKLNVKDVKIISDVDDCLFYTSESIKNHGLKKVDFWFNDDIYNEYKLSVFQNAKLTNWGSEFLELVNGHNLNYLLLTAGRNRMSILKSKLGVDENNVIEGIGDEDKIYLLNNIKEKCIYVDDKYGLIPQITNTYIKAIHYPQ